MKEVCAEVESLVKSQTEIFCITFKTGWCFPEDKVKLLPTRESQILSGDQVRLHHPQLYAHYIPTTASPIELNRKRKKLCTRAFNSVAALAAAMTDPEVFMAKVPAFIVATKGIPKSQLRCRSCGKGAVVDNGVYGCKRRCVWDGSSPSASKEKHGAEQSVSSIVLSPGVPVLDCDFEAKSNEPEKQDGKPPTGFAWKVTPFYAVLSDKRSASAAEIEEHGLVVLVRDAGLKECIAVDPYALHLDEHAVAYRRLLTHESNSKFECLVRVHEKEVDSRTEERKLTLEALDFIL